MENETHTPVLSTEGVGISSSTAKQVEFVLMVTGSRDWKDEYKIAGYMCSLANFGWTGPNCVLINGYARGADRTTRTQALLLGWSVRDFHPDDYKEHWMSYGRACNVRNQAMVTELAAYRLHGCETRSVAFWRDHSKGTSNTLDMLAQASFTPTIVYDCPCHS